MTTIQIIGVIMLGLFFLIYFIAVIAKDTHSFSEFVKKLGAVVLLIGWILTGMYFVVLG